MLKILHRVNDSKALQTASRSLGIEVDLHAYGDRIVVHHDPFIQGEDFEDWIQHYQHAFLILNIKEEGIEKTVLQIVERKGIKNFFLLDVTPPMLFKLTLQGESRMAVRFSAFEVAQNALALFGKIEWVFIDVMEENVPLPLTTSDYHKLRSAGFKLCLVSHELWGRQKAVVLAMQDTLKKSKMMVDAVLTKHPEWWSESL